MVNGEDIIIDEISLGDRHMVGKEYVGHLRRATYKHRENFP